MVLVLIRAHRLSREEREAAYNKARERIFGNPEKAGDATPGMDDLVPNFLSLGLTIIQIRKTDKIYRGQVLLR